MSFFNETAGSMLHWTSPMIWRRIESMANKELMRRMDILQTLAIFTLLAAPTLFDFLVAILGDTDKKDRALESPANPKRTWCRNDMKWYSWKGIVAKNAVTVRKLPKDFVFFSQNANLETKMAATQVMYVALIGLQFIERIYIGPNEANGFIATFSSWKNFPNQRTTQRQDVVMGKLAAWKRVLVLLAKVVFLVYQCSWIVYCWWKRLCRHQLRLVAYPIIYGVLNIPGGAGFLPSKVLLLDTGAISSQHSSC